MNFSIKKSAKIVCGIIACLALLLNILFLSPAHAEAGLILSYQVEHDLLAAADMYRIDVYEDGSVSIHYPDFMKKAGDYSVQLSPSELQRLKRLLDSPSVQGFDANDVASQKNARAFQSTLTATSDASYSTFEIVLPESSAARGSAADNRKQISWPQLQLDAVANPAVFVLQELAEIETFLNALTEHPSVQKLQ